MNIRMNIKNSHIYRTKRYLWNLSEFSTYKRLNTFHDFYDEDITGSINRSREQRNFCGDNYSEDPSILSSLDDYDHIYLHDEQTDIKSIVELFLNFNKKSINFHDIDHSSCLYFRRRQYIYVLLDTLVENFIRLGNLLKLCTDEVQDVKIVIQLNHTSLIICRVTQGARSYAMPFWTHVLYKIAGKQIYLLNGYRRCGDHNLSYLQLGEVLLLKLVTHIYCASDFQNTIVSAVSICLCTSLKLLFEISSRVSLQMTILSIFADIFGETDNYLPEMLHGMHLYSLSRVHGKDFLTKLFSSILNGVLMNQQYSPALSELLVTMNLPSKIMHSIKSRKPLHWRARTRVLLQRDAIFPQEYTFYNIFERGIMHEYKKLSRAARLHKKAVKRELQKVSYSLGEINYEKKRELFYSRRKKRQKNLSMLEDEKGKVAQLRRTDKVDLRGGGKTL